MNKVVWSLFDGSGIMSLPWAEAGCKAYCFNADDGNHGEYFIKMKHPNIEYINVWIDELFLQTVAEMEIPAPDIVFGFPDCTMFAHSGAQHDRSEYELRYALMLAKMVRATGQHFGVPWMIENPVGKLSAPNMLGKPNFYFNPFEFGGYMSEDDEPFHAKMPKFDGYTKKTCIWYGNGFVEPEKRPGPVNIGFFWGWKYLGGKSAKTKQLRSLTPRGFARAVFEANKGE